MNLSNGGDVINFGFQDDSLGDIKFGDLPEDDFDNFNRQNPPAPKGSLINFNAIGNQNITQNDINDDKPRLLPSRFLAGQMVSPSDSPRQSVSPRSNPYELPPLETLLDSDEFNDMNEGDNNHDPFMFTNQQEQKPQSMNILKLIGQQKQPPTQHQYESSDKTSVTISDSDSVKPIPNFKQQSAKNSPPKQNVHQKKNNQSPPKATTQSPPKPKEEIKMDISTAFDYAIDDFHHYFFKEFQAILKPSSLPIVSPEINNFAFSLTDEIAKLIEVPITGFSQNIIERTNENLGIILREETNQIIQSIKQKSLKVKAQEEKDFDDLQRLHKELNDLVKQYRQTSIHILKSMENERVELARINFSDKETQKAIMGTKQKLNLKLLELKSIAERQNNEMLRLQRSQNNIYIAKDELHENLLDGYDIKYKNLRSKISHEIDKITDFLDDPTFESISEIAEEIRYNVRYSDNTEDSQQMQIQQLQQKQYLIEMQNMYAINQLERMKRKEDDDEVKSIKKLALTKLEELRKQREEAMKSIKKSKRKK